MRLVKLLAILYYQGPKIIKEGTQTIVSNGTGQCNFLGQRDRSSFVVPGQSPGQRDKLKILSRDRTGQDSQNSGQDGSG